MRAPFLGTLLGIGLFASAGHSQYPVTFITPVFRQPIPSAPDACGPGWYTVCPDGTAFGPNYSVYPPWPPFNGMLPGPQGKFIMAGRPVQPPIQPQFVMGPHGVPMPAPSYAPGAEPRLPNVGYEPPPGKPQQPVFVSHPYVRSPRDFFMWGEMLEEQRALQRRPPVVPCA